jgi:hypothetical protein
VINNSSFNWSDIFRGVVDKEVLESLGVTAVVKQKRVLQAIGELNDMFINQPKNALEWRTANRHLFTWLANMHGGAPRLLLLWFTAANFKIKPP